MVTQGEGQEVRGRVEETAATRSMPSLFSDKNASICFCGVVVVGPPLCRDCSERMSRALQRPLLVLDLENTG